MMRGVEGVIEPTENLRLDDGVAVGWSLVGAWEELVGVLVADFSDEALMIPAGAILVTCEEDVGLSICDEDIAEDLGVASEVAEASGDPAPGFGAGDAPLGATACLPPPLTPPFQRPQREHLLGEGRGG